MKISEETFNARFYEAMQSIYLTDSINADVVLVVGAGGAIFHLARHGEEEVKVFCNAVQLTDVLVCTDNRETHAMNDTA